MYSYNRRSLVSFLNYVDEAIRDPDTGTAFLQSVANGSLLGSFLAQYPRRDIYMKRAIQMNELQRRAATELGRRVRLENEVAEAVPEKSLWDEFYASLVR